MKNFVKVAQVSDVLDGEMKTFDLNGEKITLVNLGEQFFATSSICSHEHCEMDGGWLEGQNIVCPCHGSQFDLKTGEVKSLPATESLKTYETQIKEGEVFVKI